MDCPNCGSWATVGIEHPSVDVAQLDATLPASCFYGSKDAEGLTIESLREVKERLLPLLGPDRPVEPGARFGPLQGKASGAIDDFVWLHSWTLLVREPAFRAIREAGFMVTGVPAGITFRREPREPLVELEVPPAARIVPDAPFRICELCGRNPTIRGRDKQIDPSVPVQRIREWPTRLLITQDFADFVIDRGLTGIDWKKIDVAEAPSA